MQRKWTAAIAVFAMALSAEAAGQGGRDQSTGTVTAERSSADRSGTREFINKMAIAGMAEVQLGKVASERGQDADVKAFGQMMVTDHTRADEALKQVASQAGVQLPTQLDEKHRELVDRLMKLQGQEFDREYIKAMVEGHDDVHEQLLQQAGWISTRNDTSVPAAVGTSGSTSGDSGVRQWAMKTLPTVQQHLQRAREIRDKVEKGR
jgi:putative membrane protein